jgi:hypothetical protein
VGLYYLLTLVFQVSVACSCFCDRRNRPPFHDARPLRSNNLHTEQGVKHFNSPSTNVAARVTNTTHVDGVYNKLNIISVACSRIAQQTVQGRSGICVYSTEPLDFNRKTAISERDRICRVQHGIFRVPACSVSTPVCEDVLAWETSSLT